MKKPEILAPAGSMKAMEAAVKAGADAVYMGGSRFGARAYADNPEKDELIEAIHYVHVYGKKIYLTLNTLLKEEELDLVGDFLLPYYEAGLDGIIIQDPGVFSYVRNNFPGLPLHASTQMNITDAASARLLKEAGACRVVPARELSLEEIRTIKEETGLEIETFVHGALCYCYSGRCLMSSILGGRSGNRGRCAQPCRLPYEVRDNKNGSYVLSPKDLCAISLIPQLVEAGIDSFKIEGRMKSPEYVAAIVSVYRKYLDSYLAHPEQRYEVAEQDWQILLEAYNRGGFTKGYYYSHNGPEMMSMERPNHRGMKAGIIEKIRDGKIYFHPEIEIHKGDGLEVEIPGEKDNITLTSPSDGKKGENYILNGRKISDLRQGYTIYRTGNSWMKKQLSDQILDQDKKILISGRAEFFAGQQAKLTVMTKDGIVYVSAGELVQKAQDKPMNVEQTKKPLMQTGNSRFEFEELDVILDDSVFYPVGALKKLRRQALHGLEDLLGKVGTRPAPQYAGNWKRADKVERKGDFKRAPKPEIRVSLEDKEKVWDILEYDEVDGIYLPLEEFSQEERFTLIEKAKKAEKKLFYVLPYVFRKPDKNQYENLWEQIEQERPAGILIRNIDEFAWVRENKNRCKAFHSMEVILDYSLYAYNQEASHMYQTWMGQKLRQTLPLELNRKEWRQLLVPESEIMVYGRIPLMVSAQCVMKNTSECQHHSGYLSMKDRYGKTFYVRRHCRHCYNTVWNGVPLSLQGLKEELSYFSPSSLRLHFTVEKKEEIRRIIRTFYEEWNNRSISSSMQGDFTRGHYKRGVE